MAILTGGPLGGINLRGPIAQSLEPETVTYFAAMDAAGESYWPSEKALIDNLIKSLKSASLWARPTLLWMPVGASLSGAMRALKHPLGVGTAMSNNGFTADRWNRLTGLDGRGVPHWIGTGTTESTYTPSDDTHIAVDISAVGGSGANREIGNLSADRFQLILAFGGVGKYYRSFTPGTAFENSATNVVLGVGLATRKSGSCYFIHESSVTDATTNTTPPDFPAAGEIVFFKGNPSSTSDKAFAFASIGKGFTQSEALQYSSILQSARAARAALTPP